MLKKTRVYMALASLLAVIKLLTKSIYLNFTGKNNRDTTDALAHAFATDILTGVDAKVTLKGNLPPLLPGRSYILISNHASHFDIPAIYATIPFSIRMIAKKELFDIPFFGTAMRKHEFIRIDRQDRKKALAALNATKQMMESGIVIWAAAEGTRTRTGELLPFKKGIFMLAIDAQAIVVPVSIKGTFNILPADTWDFTSGQQVTVTVGDPIDTQGMDSTGRDTLMSAVRMQIEQQLQEN